MDHLKELPESWRIHFGAMGAEAFRSGINTLLASGKARIEHEKMSPGTGYTMPTGRRRLIIELG